MTWLRVVGWSNRVTECSTWDRLGPWGAPAVPTDARLELRRGRQRGVQSSQSRVPRLGAMTLGAGSARWGQRAVRVLMCVWWRPCPLPTRFRKHPHSAAVTTKDVCRHREAKPSRLTVTKDGSRSPKRGLRQS